jgi:parvulin-like peptidyl-prolyl isomerase
VVGEEKITAKQFEQFVQGLPEQYRSAAMGPMKRQIADQFVQVRLLAQEARKRGLDKDPVVLSQMQFQSDNLLAGALYRKMQDEVKGDEAALKAAYDARKSEFEQVQARHILIRYKGSPVPLGKDKADLTEEQSLGKATELRKRIVAGEDFAAVAKAESDDTGSGANGGDLGSFRRGQMVPEFEKVAFALPVGEVSEPLKTQFGYHIIKVEKRESKNLEEVKNELVPELAKKAADDFKSQSNVKLDEAYFGPVQPAQPPVAAAPPPVSAPASEAK